METEEVVQLLLRVILLATVLGILILLFSGKAGSALEAIKNILRFGR